MVTSVELRKKLNEATKNGRYFVTITHAEGKELKHFMMTNKFPKEDIIPTLEHFAQQAIEEFSLEESDS